LIRKTLLPLLAYTRIPGNAFSFWVRQTLRWSRGTPTLANESKDDLFAYLQQGRRAAEARAAELQARYRLEPLGLSLDGGAQDWCYVFALERWL